ncbi:WD40 repeat domain-containing protein [Chloropicon primus]|uniref:WD40 repeat domain-containing protein n=1 Tax=Chloropicon primus TaxID=1764295 RepID=A0A5B8MU95_9CHLO|nr:WD40 repeat domain-containing protein [Chloropicon primus]UPR02227.1 WD40 repeat domain-containing protein [Chloropicon primus]|mmetsp:Transcript_4015/g.11663  ORF Transcript_4015/g.11663 Transcript_4015/m.11663 type:complete len:498 (-) Transcript_4015:133-1626(-)|eukprot:QDZ23010.1 WD40 repeat domain-containing protein [Chloropicon primus]
MDLPVDSWRLVGSYLDDNAKSCAALACVNRSSRYGCHDEGTWRKLFGRDYLPQDCFPEVLRREELEEFVGRFDERRIERTPSSLSLDKMGEQDAVEDLGHEGRSWRARYFSYARGKPVEESVVRHAHCLRNSKDVVLYGSRVNALVLDPSSVPTANPGRSTTSCWSCGGDGVIHKWDFARGKRVLSIRGAHQLDSSNFKQVNNMGVECADSCGPQTLITGGCDKGISLWDGRKGGEVWHKGCAHYDEVLSIKSSRSLPVIVSGGADDCVRVWDLRSYEQPLLELDTLHGGSVFCISIDEERKTVLTGSGDKTISMWGLETGHWYAQAHGHTGDVYDIKQGKQGRILSASDDGTVREWSLEGKQEWFQELYCVSTLGITADMNQDKCELDACNLDDGASRKSFRSVTHMTCLELLGEEEMSFLGGCWSGDIVLGKMHGGIKPFSQPITKHAESEEHKGEFDAYLIPDVSHSPVTAITAESDCVITGFNNGAVRFSRMA